MCLHSNYFTHLFFFSLIVCSCQDLTQVQIVDPISGIKKVYWIDKDSLIQGEKLVYIDQGKVLNEKSNYIDGQLSGDRFLYRTDGTLEIKEHYQNDYLEDTLLIYYPSGMVKLKMPYAQGVLTGQVLQYYESGKLMEQVTYVENQENGPFVEFHENGQIKWKGQYLNGDNEFGILEQYDEEGHLSRKLSCDSSAICRTIWTKEKGDIVPL